VARAVSMIAGLAALAGSLLAEMPTQAPELSVLRASLGLHE
jgi:hypothetical protein